MENVSHARSAPIPPPIIAPQPVILLARQAIFDTSLRVVAYELLYRCEGTEVANVRNGDEATSHVMMTAVSEVGLQRLVGDATAFVNVTRDFIVGRLPIVLPRARLVLEILETVEPEPEVVDALRALGAQGYRIALDDFEFEERKIPLLEVAHVVKLDVLDKTPEQVAELVRLVSPHCSTLVAEKIETHEMFALCKRLGFKYFQGYFLARPDLMKAARAPQARLGLIELLAQLYGPDADIRKIGALVSRDVGLTTRLMKCLASASNKTSHAVKSVQHAVAMLGLGELRRWVTLLSISQVADKPSELLRLALTRSRMCELLSRAVERGDPETAATVGLLSVLDALTDRPLAEIIGDLPLNESVIAAIVEHRGREGELLEVALGHEMGNMTVGDRFGIDAATLTEAWLLSVEEAARLSRQIGAQEQTAPMSLTQRGTTR